MDDTTQPGPFPSYSLRDEIVLDIRDMIAFLKRLNVEIAEIQLESLSVDELQYELNRLNRYLRSRLTAEMPRGHLVAGPGMSDEDDSSSSRRFRTSIAGSEYSIPSGMHISARSG